MPITPRSEIIFDKGQGSWLFDTNGRRYLDFVQGWAVNSLGHSNPSLVAALQKQLDQLINPSPAYYNRPMLNLSNLLVNNSDFDHVFFTNSGAEANEGAIKLVRKWGSINRADAYKIITFDNSFHGRTLTTMSASGKSGWDELFKPKMPGFIKVPYNNINAVKAAIDEQTVAIMLEPIQGEAGVIVADRQFLQDLRKLTIDHNLLLIFDEIQTGMGRTGSLFNYQQAGITPDIMTLGKGIGGGVPLGALLATQHCSCFEYGEQGGTFNGNALCCSAGMVIMQTLIQEGFLEQVQQTGNYLEQGLKQLSRIYQLGEVRGSGLLWAIDTAVIPARNIANEALKQGLLINPANDFTLRFMPALNVSTQEIDAMLEILDSTLRKLSCLPIQ